MPIFWTTHSKATNISIGHLPLGLGSLAYISQCINDGIRFIFGENNFHSVNYTEDMAVAGHLQLAKSAFIKLGEILNKPDFEKSTSKLDSPHTRMVFLAVIKDSIIVGQVRVKLT